MPCYLIFAGKKLDPERLARRLNLKISSNWRKGEPRFKSKPKGKKNPTSGLSILTSNADFDNLPGQFRGTLRFLKRHRRLLKGLKRLRSIDSMRLDFGFEWREVPVQKDTIPADLVAAAGELGIRSVLPRGKADPYSGPLNRASDRTS